MFKSNRRTVQFRGRKTIRFGIAIVLAICMVLGIFCWLGDNMSTIPAPQPVAPAVPANAPVLQPVSRDPVPVVADNRISVQGKVTDENGNGIGHAGVIIDIPMSFLGAATVRKELSATADAAGEFTLPIAKGKVDAVIFVSADGYAREIREVHVPEYGLEGLVFVLQKPGSIAGHVIDSNGVPVEHISVEAQRANTDLNIQYDSETTTGKDGAFLIPAAQPGEYTLHARYLPPSRKQGWMGGLPVERDDFSGASSALATVTVKQGETLSDIVLVLPWSADRSIRGTVIDETGRPVKGAVAWAEMLGGGPVPLGLCAIETGADGRFQIQYLREVGDSGEPEAVNIGSRAEGYEEGITEAVPVGSNDTKVVLMGLRRGSIAGVVIDATTKEPIVSANVYLYSVNRERGDNWSSTDFLDPNYDASVSTAGKFTIREVPVGLAALKAYAPGYGMSTPEKVSVHVGQTTQVEIALLPEGKLEVNVRSTGRLTGTRFGDFSLDCWPIDQYQFGDPGTVMDYNHHEEMRGIHISPTFSDPGLRTFYLQPGRYAVAAVVLPSFEEDVSIQLGRSYVYGEAVVESGKTTQMDLTVGGETAISGYLAPERGEKLTVTLAAGKDANLVQGDRDVIPVGLPTAGACLTYRLRAPGSFLFLGVPEGTYTATLSATSANNPEPRVVATKTIEVAGSDELTLEFP